jgi:hypothetical protein
MLRSTSRLQAKGWARPACTVAALLTLLLAPRTSSARTPDVDLAWSAPVECPSREAVVQEIERTLRGSTAPRVRTTARVDVTQDDHGRWHASLEVDTRGGQSARVLEAESCGAIASAAAVIVALAVEGGVAPAPLPPKPPPPEPPPPKPTAPSPPSPAAPPATTQGSQLLVGAAGVLDDATMPNLAPGAELTLGWAYRVSIWRLRLLASGEIFPVQNVSFAGRPGNEGGHFGLLAGAARACGGIVGHGFDLGPCVGAEVDEMSASGVGSLTRKLTGSATWGAIVGSALASWSPWRPLAIVARLDGLLPVARPQFVIDNPTQGPTTVHQPSAAAMRVALGIELRFF